MPAAFFGPKLPFQLDQTASGKSSSATIASTEYADIAGQIWLVSRLPMTHDGPATANRPSLALAVRNLSGGAFTPTFTVANRLSTTHPLYVGKCVVMKVSGSDPAVFTSQFSGASSTTVGGLNYPMCHLAPAMAANDVAWAICDGPAWVATSDNSSGSNDIDAGEFVIPDSDTAGRVEQQTDPTAATTVINEVNAVIGRAMVDLGGADKDDYSLPIIVCQL